MTDAFFFGSDGNTILEALAFADFTSVQAKREGIRTLPLPGVRCQKCAENGEEVWVVPGLICGKCGTPAPSQDLSDFPDPDSEE
ncbi:uncharacterized protein P884DRAFT_264297 [Thermothelomyces heterothallicus CBS 202.75]|uniref:uncharacterized protein n=1 Tax=Thermothelomyces heterothallicus CBS 202.75 TaxID=1149848 RepID=UPI0037427B5C